MDLQGIPPTLIFYAGDRMNLDVLAPAFSEALTKAGSPSRAVDTVTLDHGQIHSHIGMIDEPMTALIMRLHAGEDASRFPSQIDGKSAPAATHEPSSTVPDNAKPEESKPASSKPASASSAGYQAPFPIAFTRDYTPGTKDCNGQFMGGTETMRLAAHDGEIVAGLGYWTDQPGSDPQPGAQILFFAETVDDWRAGDISQVRSR